MLRKTSTGCHLASFFGVLLSAVLVSCNPILPDSPPVEPEPDSEAPVPEKGPEPDSLFVSYCLEHFDSDSDGVISEKEALDVKVIDLESTALSYEIKSLEGISAFPNLEVLKISCETRTVDSYGNLLPPENWNYHPGGLVKLDLSANSKLRELSCNGHRIVELKLANGAPLELLSCTYNSVLSLALSKLAELRELYLDANCLESLDLSSCLKLEHLSVAQNRLKSVKAEGLPALKDALLSSNRIERFGLGECPGLLELQLSDNNLDSLDISCFPGLNKLIVAGNSLTKLDSSMNPVLQTLGCERNRLTSLDLAKNPGLKTLRCSENLLSRIDVSMLDYLSSLDCAPMDDEHSQNTLKQLLVFKGQSIRFITYDRNDKYIPRETQIIECTD